MSNPLFNSLGGNMPMNPMLKQIMDFRKGLTGNPQEIIQQMLNSGRISQAQVNQNVQRANELYKQFGNFLK